jgi:hypothetical protein
LLGGEKGDSVSFDEGGLGAETSFTGLFCQKAPDPVKLDKLDATKSLSPLL